MRRRSNGFFNVLATATVEADDVIRARVPAREFGYLAGRLVLTGPAGATCKLYTGEPRTQALVDLVPMGASSGGFDVTHQVALDYNQPIYVEPFAELVAVWVTTGTPPSAYALIRVSLEEVV